MIIGLIDNDVCNDYCAWSKSLIFSIRVHKITAMLPVNDGLQTDSKKITRVELLNKNLRRSVGNKFAVHIVFVLFSPPITVHI